MHTAFVVFELKLDGWEYGKTGCSCMAMEFCFFEVQRAIHMYKQQRRFVYLQPQSLLSFPLQNISR